MTESNTDGSMRNVIDAFVSAQENKRVAQGGATQNVATINKVAQPTVPSKKPSQKRKNIWKVLIPVLAVAVVGVAVVAIVVNLPQEIEMNDEEKEMAQEIAQSSGVSGFTSSVDNLLETDPNYTLEDAERDYEEMIKNSTLEEKYRLVTSYAFLIKEQTGDAERAANILKGIEGEVSKSYLARYYISLSEIYEGVQDEEANRYYRMALELDNEENGL